MDAFSTSVITVALAEIGDKTQLLTLLLATRFNARGALITGIVLATLVNHGLSAWLGSYVGNLFAPNITNWLVALSFMLVGAWLLVPDKAEATTGRFDKLEAFGATFILFSVAELGDKTQVATVLLGAEYHQIMFVTVGTTVGMLVANVPVIFLGEQLLRQLPVKQLHRVAAALFIGLGFATLWR
ncbi:TMEM165/GDT1 family protein [Salinimonas marina]|uniref:GDT1 family protein n=1 Tax=Salinimonas marina TaxID=2785918 RepID=A0A7S9E1E8_9ALTE|nr:TMEM165/GDT1 family protein [Salinimonas marina]QPG07255.1 TMEM165/GDT1 family protein [Salinimonas marina]